MSADWKRGELLRLRRKKQKRKQDQRRCAGRREMRVAQSKHDARVARSRDRRPLTGLARPGPRRPQGSKLIVDSELQEARVEAHFDVVGIAQDFAAREFDPDGIDGLGAAAQQPM